MPAICEYMSHYMPTICEYMSHYMPAICVYKKLQNIQEYTYFTYALVTVRIKLIKLAYNAQTTALSWTKTNKINKTRIDEQVRIA